MSANGSIVRGAVGWQAGSLLMTLTLASLAWAADPKGSAEKPKASLAAGGGAGRGSEVKLPTEVDISGPYHAQIGEETFPANLEIWGLDAILKIATSGQDRPMLGGFLKDQLKVVAQYGAENFNLTTMVEAKFDGRNFGGKYSRADVKVGAKVAALVMTPTWCDGGAGTSGSPLPIPRPPTAIPGTYAIHLSGGGRKISDLATMELEGGTLKMQAGGREYRCDCTAAEMFPMYWAGTRMDTFRIEPSTYGFKGALTKEVAGKEEKYEVELVKGQGDGAGGDGHDHDWTYVYDVLINNTLPIYIAKVTLHGEAATTVINIKGDKATTQGSLVDNVLSGTGHFGKSAFSIRAQRTAHGFTGVFRKGSGALVQEGPLVMKNRPSRVAGGTGW